MKNLIQRSTPTSKILVIAPRLFWFSGKHSWEFPMGMASISACLKQAGHDVDVLNINHFETDQKTLIRDKMVGQHYDFVLTGGLSPNYNELKSVVQDVRNVNSNVCVIIGGGVISATPELMDYYLRPDYVVIGEGELTIVRLIDEINNGGKQINNVKGIGYHDEQGKFIQTPIVDAIRELDALPWPDVAGFDIDTYFSFRRPNSTLYHYVEDYPRLYPIISSRSCPYSCTFCYHPLGKIYRSRSLDDFIAEAAFMIENYDINGLIIYDELLSVNTEKLLDMCQRLENLPKKLRWVGQLRADCIDEKTLKAMKASGCFQITYGFESASDNILKSMKKKINVGKIKKAMVETREAGICVQANFIFGDPAETIETAYNTLDFWKEKYDYHCNLGFIVPYPGAPIWFSELEKHGKKEYDDQIDFIEEMFANPPNMTKIPDSDWKAFKIDLQKSLFRYRQFCEVVSATKSSDDTHKITIICPHCEQSVTYDRIHQRATGIFQLPCRNCNQIMDVTPLIFEHIRHEYPISMEVYKDILDNNRPTMMLPCLREAVVVAIEEEALADIHVVGYLDSSDAKTGLAFRGTKILNFSKEVVAPISKEVYFIIPHVSQFEKIIEKLISFGVPRMHICCLEGIFQDIAYPEIAQGLDVSKFIIEDNKQNQNGNGHVSVVDAGEDTVAAGQSVMCT